MAIAPSSTAQIVQSGCNAHGEIRQTIRIVAEDIFRDPTDFDPSNRVFGSNAGPRQFTVVPFLARRQVAARRLFFG